MATTGMNYTPWGQQQTSPGGSYPTLQVPHMPNYNYPQSQRPQYAPPPGYGASQSIGDSINNAFGGGNSYPSGGGSTMPSQRPNDFASPNSYSSPTLLDMGNNVGRNMGGWLMQGFQQAPGGIANAINSGFDQYQAYTDRQSDRQLKMDIVDRLLDGINGMGGGGGNRMSGFMDMNSGQAASLPGQTTNAITANALSPQQISQAAGMARGATSSPATSAGNAVGTPGAASEVNAIAQASARARGGQNGNQIDRTLTAENANLQRAIELARSNQGLGNAGFLVNLNADNTQRDVALKAPLLRSLLSGVANMV